MKQKNVPVPNFLVIEVNPILRCSLGTKLKIKEAFLLLSLFTFKKKKSVFYVPVIAMRYQVTYKFTYIAFQNQQSYIFTVHLYSIPKSI